MNPITIKETKKNLQEALNEKENFQNLSDCDYCIEILINSKNSEDIWRCSSCNHLFVVNNFFDFILSDEILCDDCQNYK